MRTAFSWERFEKVPVVGIMRNLPLHIMQKLVTTYIDGGLTNLEITMNSAAATTTIKEIADTFGGNLNIGAGTVCTLTDLDAALAAGAQFIVTPIVNEDVITACVQADIPVFPGGYTPTEIYKAWSLGASMVKIFPATRLGPEYIKEVLAPLNQVKLMPTGGVTLDNCTDFIQAGAKALGLGSSLFPKDLIATEDWSGLKKIFESFVYKMNA